MKKLTSVLLVLIMAAMTFAASIPASANTLFSDVEAGRWSESSITNAFNHGYMTGVGDGKFDPAGSMTRWLQPAA